MNGARSSLVVLSITLALAACDSAGDPPDGGAPDADLSPSDAGLEHPDGGPGPDGGAPTDGSAPTDADAPLDAEPPPFQAIEPCGEPGDYVDGTYIASYDSLEYDPPCLRVRRGVAVTIEATDAHPLASRAGGSPSNPFPSSPATSTVSITFDAPGFYPYVCTLHSSLGMIGVVQVVP